MLRQGWRGLRWRGYTKTVKLCIGTQDRVSSLNQFPSSVLWGPVWFAPFLFSILLPQLDDAPSCGINQAARHMVCIWPLKECVLYVSEYAAKEHGYFLTKRLKDCTQIWVGWGIPLSSEKKLEWVLIQFICLICFYVALWWSCLVHGIPTLTQWLLEIGANSPATLYRKSQENGWTNGNILETYWLLSRVLGCVAVLSACTVDLQQVCPGFMSCPGLFWIVVAHYPSGYFVFYPTVPENACSVKCWL